MQEEFDTNSNRCSSRYFVHPWQIPQCQMYSGHVEGGIELHRHEGVRSVTGVRWVTKNQYVEPIALIEPKRPWYVVNSNGHQTGGWVTRRNAEGHCFEGCRIMKLVDPDTIVEPIDTTTALKSFVRSANDYRNNLECIVCCCVVPLGSVESHIMWHKALLK